MIRASRSFVAVTALLLAAAAAAQVVTERPARVLTSTVKSSVIVEAIDYETREIRVIDAGGNRFSIMADEAVNNLEQIQPRDRIVTEYMQSVAIIVATDDLPELPQGAVGAIAPEGDTPGIAGLETVMLRAEITSIDRERRRVGLTDAEGNTSTVPVADAARLDMVDVGDEVRVRLTRAVAISVEKPPGN